MYNLHAHSLLSDGSLLPSEVAVRYAAAGYKVLAITDHADYSNIRITVGAILDFTKHWPKKSSLKVLAGIELTHLPLEQFKPLAKYARQKGIKIIVAHGETAVEPVLKGTNHAALQADIDILSHPGYISNEDILLAKKKGVFLELTSRSGHSNTNQFVAEAALRLGAPLILNNDSHQPADIITPSQLREVGRSAGLSEPQIDSIYKDIEKFLRGK